MGGGRAFAREEIRGEFFLFFLFFFHGISVGWTAISRLWQDRLKLVEGRTRGWALDITYAGVFFAVPSNVFVAAPLGVC